MFTYRPEAGADLYPFLQKTPFPTGCITYIKLALKNTYQVPFITSIHSDQNYFSIELQTQHTYIGNFLYDDNQWITLNNQNVFGFVLLGVVPTEKFSYSGKWNIHRTCYTFPIHLQGLQKASFSGLSVQPSQILSLVLAGDLTLRDNSDSSKNTINIGRDSTDHLQYTKDGFQPTTYVKSINGIIADSFIITSSDSSIEVLPVLNKGNDTYVIYLNTKRSFPACPQWAQSDSKSF